MSHRYKKQGQIASCRALSLRRPLPPRHPLLLTGTAGGLSAPLPAPHHSHGSPRRLQCAEPVRSWRRRARPRTGKLLSCPHRYPVPRAPRPPYHALPPPHGRRPPPSPWPHWLTSGHRTHTHTHPPHTHPHPPHTHTRTRTHTQIHNTRTHTQARTCEPYALAAAAPHRQLLHLSAETHIHASRLTGREGAGRGSGGTGGSPAAAVLVGYQ